MTTKASAGAKSPSRPSRKKKVLKAATVVNTALITAGSTFMVPSTAARTGLAPFSCSW